MHAIDMLKDRGMDNPEQWAHLDPAVIKATVRWYDEQNGRVGIGVLVNELRKGGRQPARRRDPLAEQQTYADELVAWVRRHLPEVDRPRHGPHPAAVAAVIRLQWQHGKRLSAREHGAAV